MRDNRQCSLCSNLQINHPHGQPLSAVENICKNPPTGKGLSMTGYPLKEDASIQKGEYYPKNEDGTYSKVESTPLSQLDEVVNIFRHRPPNCPNFKQGTPEIVHGEK